MHSLSNLGGGGKGKKENASESLGRCRPQEIDGLIMPSNINWQFGTEVLKK